MNMENIDEFFHFLLSEIKKLNNEDSHKILELEKNHIYDNPILINILKHVDSGIIVIDNYNNILLINREARKAFNIHNRNYTPKNINTLIQQKNIFNIKQTNNNEYSFTYPNNKTNTYAIKIKKLCF